MSFSFIPTEAFYRTPQAFSFDEYLEVEHEMWMLFPETENKRVCVIQHGLAALLFVETPDDKSEIGLDETYCMMPCGDGHLQPIRMKATRHLTLDEFRMASYSSMKLTKIMAPLLFLFKEIGAMIAGEQIVEELDHVDNT